MKKIRYINTLFYYDGPQVFEARDPIGGHYIAVMLGPEGINERCLVTGVEPEQLRQFRSGLLDLRSLLIESDEDERYLTTVGEGLDSPLVLEPLKISLLDSGFLPESNFVLHDSPSDDSVLIEARQRSNLILEIAAEPPEAVREHRIRANTLAEMLNLVQSMVRKAYRAEIGGTDSSYRQQNDDMMDVVVPAAAGSFQVVLEAASMPDLFGDTKLTRALKRIDDLFEDPSNPVKTRMLVEGQRGHLAKAYLNFLRFLVKRKTGFRYSWAEPQSEQPISHAVSQFEASSLIKELATVTSLGSESLTLEGIFERFNRDSGRWGLTTNSGKPGGLVKKGGPSLDGLEVGGRYIFHCEEEIEVDFMGEESHILYLESYEPA